MRVKFSCMHADRPDFKEFDMSTDKCCVECGTWKKINTHEQIGKALARHLRENCVATVVDSMYYELTRLYNVQ